MSKWPQDQRVITQFTSLPLTYVRYKRGEMLEPRKFAPLDAPHPSVGDLCIACGKEFEPGDVVTLWPLGPGADPEYREKARTDRWFSAIAVQLHWACVTGEES